MEPKARTRRSLSIKVDSVSMETGGRARRRSLEDISAGTQLQEPMKDVMYTRDQVIELFPQFCIDNPTGNQFIAAFGGSDLNCLWSGNHGETFEYLPAMRAASREHDIRVMQQRQQRVRDNLDGPQGNTEQQQESEPRQQAEQSQRNIIRRVPDSVRFRIPIRRNRDFSLYDFLHSIRDIDLGRYANQLDFSHMQFYRLLIENQQNRNQVLLFGRSLDTEIRNYLRNFNNYQMGGLNNHQQARESGETELALRIPYYMTEYIVICHAITQMIDNTGYSPFSTSIGDLHQSVQTFSRDGHFECGRIFVDGIMVSLYPVEYAQAGTPRTVNQGIYISENFTPWVNLNFEVDFWFANPNQQEQHDIGDDNNDGESAQNTFDGLERLITTGNTNSAPVDAPRFQPMPFWSATYTVQDHGFRVGCDLSLEEQARRDAERVNRAREGITGWLQEMEARAAMRIREQDAAEFYRRVMEAQNRDQLAQVATDMVAAGFGVEAEEALQTINNAFSRFGNAYEFGQGASQRFVSGFRELCEQLGNVFINFQSQMTWEVDTITDWIAQVTGTAANGLRMVFHRHVPRLMNNPTQPTTEKRQRPRNRSPTA